MKEPAIDHEAMSMTDSSRARQALYCYSFMKLAAEIDNPCLLEHLQRSFALARSFAEAGDFQTARRRLGESAYEWGKECAYEGRMLLVANSSLATLSLIADARNLGWRLIVEECPFTRDFIAPISERCGRGIEFEKPGLLPSRIRSDTSISSPTVTLFVTFCDRPMQAAYGRVLVELSGSHYYLSVLDALLMMAAFNEVFILGRELRKVVINNRPDWETGSVSGETLIHYTDLCRLGLQDMVECDPGRYLGTVELATRSERYGMIADSNRRSLIKSLLHHCQSAGIGIPENHYHDFLSKLSALGSEG